MPISANGGPWQANNNNLLTLSASPGTTGDLMVFCFQAAATAASTAVSGGGVTTWAAAAGYLDTGNGALTEIWWGTVTSTGTLTITVTNTHTSGWCRLEAREFTGDATWAVLAASPSPPTSGGSPSGTGLTVSYPSLTGSGLYIGHGANVFGDMTGGATSGFTYDNNNGHQEVAWDTAAVNAAPTSTTDNAGGYEVAAALFGAGGAAAATPFFPFRQPARSRIPSPYTLGRPGLLYSKSLQQVP